MTKSPSPQPSHTRGEGVKDQVDCEENKTIGQVISRIEKCRSNCGYLWEQIGEAKLSDGTPVLLGNRLNDSGLYIFVGEGAAQERFVIPTFPLAQAALAVIEDYRATEIKASGAGATNPSKQL